nr:MAG TPA: hypothetical protein [Caudoviricetes sp.]
MITITNVETYGWEAAIRGMRNPMNSWDKSDSYFGDSYLEDENTYVKSNIGPNDLDLMKRLVKAGTDHRKFMRMITVSCDITAPLYWWKEFKTYRSGRKFGDDEPAIMDIIDEGYLEYDIEMNSCSTMHKIHSKEFEIDDFSHEHLDDSVTQGFSIRDVTGEYAGIDMSSVDFLQLICNVLNLYRCRYLETKDKKNWWQIIQLLPSSYNQKRTVMLNYEVLANMYKSRKGHKLDEWNEFCDWIEKLPYSELITREE